MPENLGDIVDLVHPTVSGISVITTDQAWVVFDRAIDETTLSTGNFFLTGPDFDTWSGPDLQLYLDRESLGDEEEILQSPGFHGLVQGTISFERLALDSLTTISGLDTVGSGFLYRTKAIFTPTNLLQADTDYTVYLTGDEDSTDSLQTGLSRRTVFDPVASGTNTGTGDVEFSGGYIGTQEEDTYRVEITTSGEVGTARFSFHRDSDPVSVYGPFKTKRAGVLLSDGVTATFGDGLYRVGDEWGVVVKERDIFLGNLYWPFKTGSGSFQTLPTTTATSVIGDPIETTSSTSSSTSTFSVSSTDPEDEESDVALVVGDFDITATFNKSIDPATVVSGVSISVYGEASTGEESVTASGNLTISHSVSGTDLTITVASGYMFQNNLITITLDSDIAATDGTTLGSDYEFWFTTDYYPMYCSSRLINLRVGSFISSVKTDTINLAIHAASKEADAMTWNRDNLEDDYYVFARGQWTCCRASQLLLTNTMGGAGQVKSKRLGDLAVEYNTDGTADKPLQLAEECLMRWEGALMAGGRQVQTPVMVVKGDLDPDRPPVGRGYVYTRDIHHPSNPIANRRVRPSGYRRFRNTFSRASWPKGWWNR